MCLGGIFTEAQQVELREHSQLCTGRLPAAGVLRVNGEQALCQNRRILGCNGGNCCMHKGMICHEWQLDLI